ncbi:hypothetical protein RMAECT_0797 [Rickettsia rhipicephali str. Ect]|uniref:Uncharacterized protein n=1 Tax=Rickettsia rhipicephali str. Ect TaxID=1359199 RepID=A0A0F3PEF6_RICRH|nr:hypothetical protein RMAECT_0797 [Rickettsia rhipicephali str. Ect]
MDGNSFNLKNWRHCERLKGAWQSSFNFPRLPHSPCSCSQ